MQLIDCNFCSCSRSRGRDDTTASGSSRKRARRQELCFPTHTNLSSVLLSLSSHCTQPCSAPAKHSTACSPRRPAASEGSTERLWQRSSAFQGSGKSCGSRAPSPAEPTAAVLSDRAAPRQQNHVQLQAVSSALQHPAESSAHAVQGKQGAGCQPRGGLCIFLLLWTIDVTI